MAKTDLTLENFLKEARAEFGRHAQKLQLKNGEYSVPVFYLGDSFHEMADTVGHKMDVWFSEQQDCWVGEFQKGPETVVSPVDTDEVASEVVSAVEALLKPINEELQKTYPDSGFEITGNGKRDKPYEVALFLSKEDAENMFLHIKPLAWATASEFKRDFFNGLKKQDLLSIVQSCLPRLSANELARIAAFFADKQDEINREIYHQALATYRELGDTETTKTLEALAHEFDATEFTHDNFGSSIDSPNPVHIYSLDGGETPANEDIHAYSRMIKQFEDLEKPFPISKDTKSLISIIYDVSKPEYWFEQNFDGWYAYPSLKVSAHENELTQLEKDKVKIKLESLQAEVTEIVEGFLRESKNLEKFATT